MSKLLTLMRVSISTTFIESKVTNDLESVTKFNKVILATQFISMFQDRNKRIKA